MAAILRVRDENGNIIEIPAIIGPPGRKGDPGEPGKTPVRGTDYWTAADQQSIVNDVLSALPTWEGGSY